MPGRGAVLGAGYQTGAQRVQLGSWQRSNRPCYHVARFVPLDWLIGEDMLDEESVRRLRCPVSLRPLKMADAALLERVNRTIVERGLPTRGGPIHKAPLEGGLVTEDLCYLYPIQGGIVGMLADQAIELAPLDDAST